jgi:hypothetical protein
MRVGYQAGALLALQEAGLCFFHADATSGGTMNLGMLLSGLSPRDMGERWGSLDPKGFSSFLPLKDYLNLPNAPALGSSEGVRELVFPHLGIAVDAVRSSQGMAGTFNVCDFAAKTNEVFTQDQVSLDLLVAGMSLPIFMPSVEVGGKTYMDSAWISDANLMEAVRRGADELWLVWCIGNGSIYRDGAFNQYVHMLELSGNGALFKDFERIRELNARIAAGDSPYGQKAPIRLHVIKPGLPLPLDPDYYLGLIQGSTLFEMGYADAWSYLKTRSPEGLAFGPGATKMGDHGLGVSFRETMSGGLNLGSTDTAEGAKAGRSAGTLMSLHAAISIDDVQAFIADPQHLGGLSGSIDFPPLGTGLPSKCGVFRLFSPTDNPKLKLMVYEMGFQAGGKDYYLAGQKNVAQDPIYELWRDTTTLYSLLHEGPDKSGPVVGAGILTLGPEQLIQMCVAMHATNAATPAEAAKAVSDFGRFFLGELWETYVSKAPILKNL